MSLLLLFISLQMFSEWLKSPIRIHRSPKSPRTPRHFSCTSFKDIQSLLRDELVPQPHSPIRPSIFHRIRIRTPRPSLFSLPDHADDPHFVVLYFTTLRVVRKTFDDCRTVRSILHGFGVPIDERDLSMDSKFLKELQKILGCKKSVTLPRVFIRGRYVGGAEEIKRLHENGELTAMIRGLPFVDARICDMCGGLGFILCDRCSGSNKIYGRGGFSECASCNENGLIRCPSCRLVRRRYI